VTDPPNSSDPTWSCFCRLPRPELGEPSSGPSWCPAEPPGRVEAGGRLLVRSTGENTAAAKLNWGELVAILFFKYLDRS
jgi:hypothetical protein